MPEQPGPEPRPLTPAQERAVRDLLAGARHDEPVPSDVAARLDASLADLVAARDAGTDGPAAPVVPLAARRRRRRIAGALVAAAAVVVGGVALGQVVPDSPFPTAGGGDAGTAADRALPLESAPGAAGAERRDRDRKRSTLESDSSAELRQNSRKAAPFDLSYSAFEIDPDHFTRDVRRVVERTRPDPLRSQAEEPEAALDGRVGRPACRVGDVGHGRRVHVRYDGQPALLVVRRAEGLLRRVDLFACGTDEPLRTTYLLSR